MVDDPYHTLLQKEQIDLRTIGEVELWTNVLDIYTTDLFNAVTAVGTSSAAVLQYILDNGLVGRVRRTPNPKPKSPGKPPGGGGEGPTQ